MSRRRLQALAAICLVAFAPAARAQSSIAGVWGWQNPDAGGMDANVLSLGPDGTFLRASRLANGTILRSWGFYRATPVGPGQVRLQTRVAGWLPQQICVVGPGAGQSCQPAPPATPLDLVVTRTSDTSLQAEGNTLGRLPDSPLLHMPVGQVATITVAPPPQAMAQGPVQPYAPQLHPYVTPNGPGNRAADAYHAQNQEFINGHMRGCVKDQYGRWVGCQQ